MRLIAILSIFIVAATCEKARYDNYRVYEIFVANENHLELMREIQNYPDGVRDLKIKLKLIKRLVFSIV